MLIRAEVFIERPERPEGDENEAQFNTLRDLALLAEFIDNVNRSSATKPALLSGCRISKVRMPDSPEPDATGYVDLVD